MRVRRCHTLLIEPREIRAVDLNTLLAGEARLASSIQWVALAAHLDGEIVLDPTDLLLLGRLSPTQWTERSSLAMHDDSAAIDRLIACGLAILEDSPERSDRALRENHWHGLAAVAHRHLRWRSVDTHQAREEVAQSSEQSMVERLGQPPPVTHERTEAGFRLALRPLREGPLDVLTRKRTTCRNFDPHRVIDAQTFGSILQRVHGAHAVAEVSGVSVLKKAVPSAGGLHPIEAYLLVQRVEGIVPGLYHYHPVAHALEPIRSLSATQCIELARSFVANQDWFVRAPVQVILAGRFRRNFWKYRSHAKAWRAIILDAGHLSQMQYLAATELGLAAFITAAVNEGEIEDAFGLDPMEEGVLAVTGFGYRGETMNDLEFDPLHAVWPDPDCSAAS